MHSYCLFLSHDCHFTAKNVHTHTHTLTGTHANMCVQKNNRRMQGIMIRVRGMHCTFTVTGSFHLNAFWEFEWTDPLTILKTHVAKPTDAVSLHHQCASSFPPSLIRCFCTMRPVRCFLHVCCETEDHVKKKRKRAAYVSPSVFGQVINGEFNC